MAVDELLLQQIHIRAAHGFGCLVLLTVRHGTGGQQRPIAFGKRLIRHLPTQLGGAFGAAVAELQADFGAAAGVDKVGDALERVGLRRRSTARYSRG